MRRVACMLALTVALLAPGAAWADECPAGGDHDYEAALVQQATDDADGLRRFTCLKCGETFDQVIPATGHAWGPWEVVEAAAPGVAGLERRVCARDASHVEERAIPALPAEEEPGPAPAAAPVSEEPPAAAEPEEAPPAVAGAEPSPEEAPPAVADSEPYPEDPATAEEPDPWSPNALDVALLGVDAVALAAFAIAAVPLLAARRWIAAHRQAARSSAAMPDLTRRGGRVL